MFSEHSESADLRWDAPGPGLWMGEFSHFPRPVTATMELLWRRLSSGAMHAECERYGLPIDFFEFRAVNGWLYSTPVAVPPVERSEREAAAIRVAEQRTWLADATNWLGRERAEWIARNDSFRAVDLELLDDGAVADHLEQILEHVVRAAVRHMELHLADMIPTGRLLAATRAVGVDDRIVVAALAGTSPASRPDPALEQLAVLAREHEIDLAAVDDLSALGDDASGLVVDYLERRGWETASRWDVDAPTINELPGAILASVRRLAGRRESAPSVDRGTLDELPVDRELVEDALTTFGLRDDNVAILGSCPVGLARRAMLEAGRRLASTARLPQPDLALEATPDELATMLRGRSATHVDELAERRRRRRAAWDADPPPLIGGEDPSLLDGAGPTSIALFDALGIYGGLMDAPPSPPMSGLGIGERTVVGRAVVAHSPDDAASELDAGDILVTFATSPGFDHLLAAAGAVVTVTGGLLSHAAVFARESGLTAVLGVAEATTMIRTGDEVIVDPSVGTVTVAAANRRRHVSCT